MDLVLLFHLRGTCIHDSRAILKYSTRIVHSLCYLLDLEVPEVIHASTFLLR